ncbi:MAG: hypothetical protein LBT42_02430 [Tannerella sp.]|nr:hypothetical protein [Tannerella sp.]
MTKKNGCACRHCEERSNPEDIQGAGLLRRLAMTANNPLLAMTNAIPIRRSKLLYIIQ